MKEIRSKGKLLAFIIGHNELKPGAYFYTPDTALLQVGRHSRNKGETIKAHRHLPVRSDRKAVLQEVLYVEKGRVKVNFYSDNGSCLKAVTLAKGDIALLVSGGHSFEFTEKTQMVEIKQGPYDPGSRVLLNIEDKK